MRQSTTIHCVSETISPLTHMSGTSGNVAMIAREPIHTDEGVVHVPYLSGNAIRHRCIREPGMRWLIQQYGLQGKLTLEQLNFLLHGGNLTKSNSRENTARIAELHRTWPLLRLLGASLPDQILSGSVDVWRGIMVCRENQPYIDTDRALRPAESYVGHYQYTRGDARKTGLATKQDGLFPDDDGASNLMIFSGQCVLRGACFSHGFVVHHATDIELGSLLHALQLWQTDGGTIGGQSSRGHGRLHLRFIAGGWDQQHVVSAYTDYAMSVKDDAIAWLEDAWS